MTFTDLLKLEPGLRRLVALARLNHTLNQPQATRNWYFHVKPKLVDLIGWGRPPDAGSDPILYSAEAYDICYEHLSSLTTGC